MLGLATISALWGFHKKKKKCYYSESTKPFDSTYQTNMNGIIIFNKTYKLILFWV